LYRTSTRSSARKIHYYRCLGSDAYRHLGKFICDNRPVREDLLDEVVWTEIVRLLEDPQLLQCEIDRRLAAARKALQKQQPRLDPKRLVFIDETGVSTDTKLRDTVAANAQRPPHSASDPR
jgi:hypothetical protein